MEEYGGTALLVHLLEDFGYDLDYFADLAQGCGYCFGVVEADCVDCVEHEGDKCSSFCFDGDGDHKEPFFILRSCERGVDREVLWLREIGFFLLRGEVPKTDSRIGSTSREL